MNKFFDLRFVIGAFFLVLGLMLVIYGLAVLGQSHSDVNIICGIIFIIFSAFMIVFSLKKNDKAKELHG